MGQGPQALAGCGAEPRRGEPVMGQGPQALAGCGAEPHRRVFACESLRIECVIEARLDMDIEPSISLRVDPRVWMDCQILSYQIHDNGQF
jgi:hypothetical protein